MLQGITVTNGLKYSMQMPLNCSKKKEYLIHIPPFPLKKTYFLLEELSIHHFCMHDFVDGNQNQMPY